MQNEKFEIVAKTFQGLEGVLAEEITAIGGSDVKTGCRMVSFTGDKALLYKANLACRTALRILKPILHFTASNPDEVYDILKQYDWEQWLSLETTFAIDSVVYSEEFRHSKFVTYRMKDAIVDFFQEKYGKRPSVRLNNADIQFNLHIYNRSCTLSLDSSGESLHKRGYRESQTEAPINEALAAGLIMLTGWRGESDFVDPMCGSGTFLIEAAMIAANIYPGIFRQHFAFEKWKDFDKDLFEELYNDDSCEREFNHKIYGSDISVRATAIAAKNIKSAGVGRYIELETKPIQKYETAPSDHGIIVTNPPYGERISSPDMEGLYEDIGNRLKHVFKGYTAWILGYKRELFDKIGLKPSAKIPVLNGALECEFRKYEIFDGTYLAYKQNMATEENNDEKPRTHTSENRKHFDTRPHRTSHKREESDRKGGFGHETAGRKKSFRGEDSERKGGFRRKEEERHKTSNHRSKNYELHTGKDMPKGFRRRKEQGDDKTKK